jgi:hypothetical protein
LDDIRNRKQLVLTTLKACIIEGGEISIQLFVKMTRHIPSNLTFPDHAHLLCSEPSTTFIQVERKYHFTYVDSMTLPSPSSPSTLPNTSTAIAPPTHLTTFLTSPLSVNILIRCFTPLPIDSLIRGVFLSLEHGEIYRSICIRYSRALEKYHQLNQEKEASFLEKFLKIGNSQNESYYLQREELVMERILTHYSKMAIDALDTGAFVQFGCWLLQIQSLLITSSDEEAPTQLPYNQHRRSTTQQHRSHQHSNQIESSLYITSSHCLKQIASLSGQSLGKLNSIHQMIISFLNCLQLFLSDYLENCFYFQQEYFNKKDSKRSLGTSSIGQTEISIASIGRKDILTQYEIICESLIEIKMVIYSLARDRDAYHSSEILSILHEFVNLIDELFHDTNTFQSAILPTSYRLTHSSNPTNIPSEIMKSLRMVMKPLTQISYGLKYLIASLGGDLLLELLQMDLDSKYDYHTATRHAVKLTSNVMTQTGDEITIFTPPLIFTELLGPLPLPSLPTLLT